MDGRITYPAFSPNGAHTWVNPQTFNGGIILMGDGVSNLNYYGEGTFTPSFTNLSGTAGFAGYYKRIGNLYKFVVIVTPSTTIIGGVGNYMNGLPFTSSKYDACVVVDSSGNNYGAGYVGIGNILMPVFTGVSTNKFVISGTQEL